MENSQRFNFFTMFIEGFKSMTLGRTLWIIVIVKLCIMFLILKPFFFPNFLNSKADSLEDKADYVRQELTQRIDDSKLENEGLK